MKKNISNIRKAVCIMANDLHKEGHTLAEAFRKAWRRVKQTMTVRVSGTTFENRQNCLKFVRQFPVSSLRVRLEREPECVFDSKAVKIIIEIPQIRKQTVAGYLPKGLASQLSDVIDAGIPVNATLQGIIGGYAYKESVGALLNIAI